jgi:ligand-binding SRPBCC domain-containing protein
MTILVVETLIDAPPHACFDAARDLRLHTCTTRHTRERVIAGPTSGLMSLGDSVTFEAVHFGIRQRLSARIVEFDPPRGFIDEMTQGAFASMRHIHEFEKRGQSTLMRDTLQWITPVGVVGVLFDAAVLKRHMRRFLHRRNRELKRIVEKQQHPVL